MDKFQIYNLYKYYCIILLLYYMLYEALYVGKVTLNDFCCDLVLNIKLN